jgi:hypothetical protein
VTTTFDAQLIRGDQRDTMGIVVPDAVVEELGAGRRPAVTVTVLGYTYRSTIARMGDQFLIGLSKENRQAAGISDEETLTVTLEVDRAPRDVDVPDDLVSALHEAGVSVGWDRLAPSARKELVRQVTTAKKPETRTGRIAKAVESARQRTP